MSGPDWLITKGWREVFFGNLGRWQDILLKHQDQESILPKYLVCVFAKISGKNIVAKISEPDIFPSKSGKYFDNISGSIGGRRTQAATS